MYHLFISKEMDFLNIFFSLKDFSFIWFGYYICSLDIIDELLFYYSFFQYVKELYLKYSLYKI